MHLCHGLCSWHVSATDAPKLLPVIIRDTRGLLRFYTMLLTNPSQIGLGRQAVAAIRRPLQLVTARDGEQYHFGQGVVDVSVSNNTNRQVRLMWRPVFT
jgi:hypothetical protein